MPGARAQWPPPLAVLKCGFLTKRAQGKSKLGKTNWKMRFFRLTSSELGYFDKNPEKDDRAVQKGSINLGAIRTVTGINYDTFQREHVFCVNYASFQLNMMASSVAEAFGWQEAIKEASVKARVLSNAKAYDDPWFFGKRVRAMRQWLGRRHTPAAQEETRAHVW